MSGEVRNVKVRLSVDNAQAVRGVKEFGDATARSAAQAQRAGIDHRKTWRAIGTGSRNAFLAGAAGLAFLERANVNFDKSMSGVDAATHETAANMKLLREAAIEAGADTQFSATEAAAGITELAKAGVKTKDVLGGGLKGALDLAAAGQLSVAEAAETAASAMTQFELEGRNVPHIADLLAAGAGKAQGSVHDLGQALNQSGLVASQTGLTIEDTTGTLAAFAKAGLIGSDAGTSFKTMLLSLNPRSAEAAELMKKYNIEAYDAQGNFIGITKYAGKLREGLKGLSDQQRAAALQTIFGTDAIRAANILYRSGSGGIRKWIKDVNDQGYAAETAARQTDNLAGDIERFTGSLESAFIKGGSGAQKGLRDIVQGAERLVDKFNQLPGSVQANVVKTVAALTLLSGGLYVVSKAVGAVQTIRGGLRPRGALGALGKATGTVPVFVTNPGFGGLPGTDLPDGTKTKPGGTKVPPAVAFGSKLATAGAVTLVASGAVLLGAAATVGIMKLFDKVAPKADIKGSPVSSTGGGGGMTLGDHPFDFSDGNASSKATKAGASAKEAAKRYREMAAASREAAQGSRSGASAFDAGYEALSRINPEIGKYGKIVRTIPKNIRSYVSTPGAPFSMAIMAKIARQYKLTPKQILTIMRLQGFNEVKAQAAAAGASYRRLPKQVKTAIMTPGAIKSEADVNRLQKRYNLTPKQKNTIMRVSGVDAAIAKTRALQIAIANVRSKSVSITLVERRTKAGNSSLTGPTADGGTIPGERYPYSDKMLTPTAPGEEVISNRFGQADKNRAALKAANRGAKIGVVGYADGGTIGSVTGGRLGDSVTVVFPAPAVYKAAVDAANKVAISAAETAISAADTRTAHLEDLHTQQRIRDLAAELAKTEKVQVKGKDGKDDNKKKKGIQDTTKTITRLALRGLDRTVAAAELADAKLAQIEAKAATRLAALEAIGEARKSTTETLSGTGDVFARGPSPMAAIRSADKQAAEIAGFGNVVARLRAAKASPALLAQLVAKAEQGDFRSAIRLGEALLAQPALLGQLNASLGTLGQVSSSVATMTTDPRFLGTGAWNPVGQVASLVQVQLGVDPSPWVTDITRRVTASVLQQINGGR